MEMTKIVLKIQNMKIFYKLNSPRNFRVQFQKTKQSMLWMKIPIESLLYFKNMFMQTCL